MARGSRPTQVCSPTVNSATLLGLTASASDAICDHRAGRNGWHGVIGLLRQSVYGRLAGCEDVNDAGRLGRDPAMRWIVGGKAAERGGASTSEMGRFETELLATDDNLAALAQLSSVWIDRAHDRNPPKLIVLDMDSSVSPTHGEQEGAAYNGHFGCACYHPLFVFNQFGGLERCALRPRTAPMNGATCWARLSPVIETGCFGATSGAMPRLHCPGYTSSSKPRASSMRSGCRPTRRSGTASRICSSAPSAGHRTTCAGITQTSAT